MKQNKQPNLDDPQCLQDVLSYLVEKYKLTPVLDELAQVCLINNEKLAGSDKKLARSWATAGRRISRIPIPAGQ